MLIIGCRNKRGRQRMPPRSNAHLNVCCVSALIVLACKGNHDVQYIANKLGGAEYVSKYASKTETADSRTILNAISRRLSIRILASALDTPLTLRVTLRAVSNALISAQQIGSVHACFVICLPRSLVQSSRVNHYVNALPRKEVTHFPIELDVDELEAMNENDDAIVNSITTTFDRRDAYYSVYKHHCEKFGNCDADFYAFLSAFKLRKITKLNPSTTKIRIGLDTPFTINIESGLIENPQSFALNGVSFVNIFVICYLTIYVFIFIECVDKIEKCM